MTTSAPTPERIMGMSNAYQGLEPGPFTALGSESKSADELAEAIETSRKGMRVLDEVAPQSVVVSTA